MDETPKQHPEDDGSETKRPARPGRRINPRLTILTMLGAFIIVLVVAVVAAFFLPDDDSSTTPSGDVGDMATLALGADDASFTATTLPPSGLLTMDGEVTDLKSVVDGKPTMINMFSSSCTACRTEMPALESVHQAAGDEVQLVGVNLGDSEKVTKDFVAQTEVTYTIVRDPKLLLVNQLNITAQPMTLWVDAEGNITGHRYGELKEPEMRKLVKENLGIDIPEK